MLPGYRSLLLGACALLIVSGCGSSSTGSSSGSINVQGGGGTGGTGGGPTGNPIGGGSGPTGSTDSVVGTPSVAGTVSVIVGVKRTISITFTSSDGRAISGFGISGSLGTLPAGWSGPTTFACASVSTGSGCVLNLTFAPVAVGSGTLTLDYVFVDNATVPNTSGSLTIAYVATPQNNIVAAASPTGQINAVVGGGSQSVIVNFTTDDGGPATALTLTTNLTALPAGWSSTATSFTCSSLSSGNGCQLSLTYAPTAAGNGTLTLSYAYQNDAGVAKTGSLNIAYRAMPPHLYVAQLTQLTPPAGALYDCLLNTDGTLSTCAQTGTGISAPTGIVFNGSSSAYVTDYGSSAVYLCNVGIDGSLSSCASEGGNFQNPLQLAINGNTLYATNANPTGGVTTCSIGVNGTLSLCTQSSGLGTAGIAANASFAYVSVDPTTVDVCAIGASGGLANCASAGGIFSGAYGITLSGGYAYIANQGNGTVSVCSINPVGTFAACAASNIGGAPTDVVIKGSQAYVNDGTGNIDLCSVDAVGAMTNCVPSNGGTSFSFGVQQIAIH